MRTFDELQELTVDCICMERNDLNRADIASSVRSYQRIYMW